MTKLMHAGEYLKSPNKKFNEVVVFVPFYQGKKPQLRRHAEFVNELGFDCVIFELLDSIKHSPKHLISSSLQFGLKHVWADQIENILNSIPQDKILFSFSNPSASAIEVVSKRRGHDIKGLVCDSGPSGEFWKSFMNYFTHEHNLRFFPLRALVATALTSTWHPKFNESIHEDLNKFPEGFRVLSIRGWKDKLISPQMIDKVFEPHTQIEWQKLSLPKAGHLNGLKDFREEYAPPVAEFLKEVATEL